MSLWQITVICEGSKKATGGRIMKAPEKSVCPVIQEADEAYRLLVHNANDAMCIVRDGHISFFNPKALEITGCSRQELCGAPLTHIVHPRDRERVRHRYLRLVTGEDAFEDTCNHRIVDTSGQIRWLEVKAIRLCWRGEPAVLLVAGDVSAREKARKELRKTKKEHRETRIMLKHKEKEAILKSDHIEEMKRAHQWMVGYNDDVLKENRKNMFYNIRENIFPLLKQLELHHGDDRTGARVELIRMNLREIMSPLAKNMTLSQYTLTKQERQVALLILHGFKTREIAEKFGLSIRSVEHHRYKIREKLGLRHAKSNLRTVLLSLVKE